MAINTWPQAERPREKLLQRGPQALSDAELLAILLRTGVRGKTAVDLARELLSKFDGLRGLFAAEQTRLCAASGLGPAKYTQLQAALEMARRHLGEGLQRGAPLTDPAATRRYLVAQLRDRPQEVFCCLYLDLCVNPLGGSDAKSSPKSLAGSLHPGADFPRTLLSNMA